LVRFERERGGSDPVPLLAAFAHWIEGK